MTGPKKRLTVRSVRGTLQCALLGGLAFAVLFTLQTLAYGCLSCHQGIEEISSTHRFPCAQCHDGDEQAADLRRAHAGLIPNPSSLEHAAQKCGSCHADQVKRVQASLMATAAGMVNQTKYLFGAQNKGETRYAASFTAPLDPLPDPETSGQAVDDLLRRKCLRCHLQNRGASRHGDYRADGCAACHMLYADDGLSQSRDRAISALMDEARSGGKTLARGYPVVHRIRTDIPVSQCSRCHNSNYVGADYQGMFERDYPAAYRFLSKDGESLRAIHGLDHHRLLPDIHFERGLACVDCHVQDELMGDGEARGFSYTSLKVGCADCHGTPEQSPAVAVVGEKDLRMAAANPRYDVSPGDRALLAESGTVLAHVRPVDGHWVLTSKVTGLKHVIPQLKGKAIVEHDIPQHITGMECYSCHAAWSFQDYGLNLMYDESPRYEQWRDLWAQNDPQIQNLLIAQLPLEPQAQTSPLTRDWLTATLKPGAWYAGWLYRRWENNILGRNARGKVSVFRPRFQFIVTRVNATGTVLEDNRIPQTADGAQGWAMNPYAPHTIRRGTVRCEGCHLNPKAIGLGLVRFRKTDTGYRIEPLTKPGKDGLSIDYGLEQIVRIDGRPTQLSTQPGARPFNREEIKGLLEKSTSYLRFRLEEWNRGSGSDRK